MCHWHGFTQMAHYDPLVIQRADGCWLYTVEGDRLFDGVASLWCNVHGHRNPTIDRAVREQLDRVAHVTTLGMSCETTERLAAKLVEVTPGDLSHVFFSSDGSSAVEAAIKMAFQYWQQREDPRPAKTKYLALSAAYHGDTTGAVSLGGIAAQTVGLAIPSQILTSLPYLVTIIILGVISSNKRLLRLNGIASLGEPFEK